MSKAATSQPELLEQLRGIITDVLEIEPVSLPTPAISSTTTTRTR